MTDETRKGMRDWLESCGFPDGEDGPWRGFRNGCSNNLKITGPEAELKRFMAEYIIMEAGRPRLDLDKLIPEPDDVTRSVLQPIPATHVEWPLGPMVGSEKILLHLQSKRGSIPWLIYEALAERFPLLKIESDLTDFLEGFYGQICCHGGKIDYEDQSEQHKAENANDLPF